MPTTYKVLGQSNPAATTATTLYTVPAGTQTVASTLSICNQTISNASYRVAIRPAGATLAAQHYIAYDVTVGGGDTTALTLGFTLAATDVVTIYASVATLSFSLFGSELT